MLPMTSQIDYGESSQASLHQVETLTFGVAPP